MDRDELVQKIRRLAEQATHRPWSESTRDRAIEYDAYDPSLNDVLDDEDERFSRRISLPTPETRGLLGLSVPDRALVLLVVNNLELLIGNTP